MLITPTYPPKDLLLRITYSVFRNMNQRCFYLKDKKYSSYGGKGIKVCERWKSSPPSIKSEAFKNFIQDMGFRSSSFMSIDRIDFDGNYEPSNCRWLPISENRRRKAPLKQLSFYQIRSVLLYWGFCICAKCGIKKPLEQIVKNSSTKTGLSPYCRDCWKIISSSPARKASARKCYWNNREIRLKKMAVYRKSKQ